MTEYGFEIKLKVVQDYLDGKGGYRYLAKKAFHCRTRKMASYHPDDSFNARNDLKKPL